MSTVLQLLIVAASLGQPKFVDLEGTVVSGVAGCYRGEQGNRQFLGVPQLTIFCADGRFDDVFNQWHTVWDQDVTSTTPPGHFHFFHPDLLQNGISLIYLRNATTVREDTGNPGYFFSKSFDIELEERGDPQRGKRMEAKVRFIVHPTTQQFTSAEQAESQMVSTVMAQSEALRLDLYPHLMQIDLIGPDDPESIARQAAHDEAALIIALLVEKEMYKPEDMRSRLSERTQSNDPPLPDAVRHNLEQWLLRDDDLWFNPNPELLNVERNRANQDPRVRDLLFPRS